jgi:hypothetical protein
MAASSHVSYYLLAVLGGVYVTMAKRLYFRNEWMKIIYVYA